MRRCAAARLGCRWGLTFWATVTPPATSAREKAVPKVSLRRFMQIASADNVPEPCEGQLKRFTHCELRHRTGGWLRLPFVEHGNDFVFFGFDFRAFGADGPLDLRHTAFELRLDMFHERHAAISAQDVGAFGGVFVDAVHDCDFSVG